MVLMLGIPYDMPIGNFERRAIVATSRFVTALLKDSQNGWNELLVWAQLVAKEVTPRNRTKLNVNNLFIMVQSAAQ